MLPKKKRVPVFLRKVAEKSAPMGDGPESEEEMAAVEEEATEMDDSYDSSCTCPKCGHEFDPDEDAPAPDDEIE